MSGVVKWLCPTCNDFFAAKVMAQAGEGVGTISGRDAVCSLPHLHHLIESAKIIVVILGNGARFRATRGFVQMSLFPA